MLSVLYKVVEKRSKHFGQQPCFPSNNAEKYMYRGKKCSSTVGVTQLLKRSSLMQSLNTSTLLDQCMGLQGQKINAWGSAVAWAPAAKCSAAMAAPDLSCVGLCG